MNEITTQSQALETLHTYERKLKAELGVDLGGQMMGPIHEYVRNLFDPERCVVKRQLTSEQLNGTPFPLKNEDAA